MTTAESIPAAPQTVADELDRRNPDAYLLHRIIVEAGYLRALLEMAGRHKLAENVKAIEEQLQRERQRLEGKHE